jgi:hypothetical protein
MGWDRFCLIRRCTIWCPTTFGACAIVALLLAIASCWVAFAESFLSVTDRLQPEVLVVEGWIGLEGVRAAKTEFDQHGYRYVVATGELHSDAWEEIHPSLADLTARELIRLGVPADCVVIAPAKESETHRTYESCRAVRQALLQRGIHPTTINIFTLGPHARRSRLTFSKVEGSATKVGVISWTPAVYRGLPWWSSSWRAKVLATESIGYIYEVLLNSGRGFGWPVRSNPATPSVERVN